MCNLKASQMNLQGSLIRELILYELELDHNTVEETKNICYAKYEGAVDHMIQEISLGLLEPNDQAMLGKLKTVHSKIVLQAIEENPASSPRRVLDDLGILQPSVACHLYNLGKSIRSCRIVPLLSIML